MRSYTSLSTETQEELDTVENLDPFDILVGDKTWQQREFLTLGESLRMWAIITKWQQGDWGAAEALASLKENDLDDPDALMLGFTAVQRVRASNPPLPPLPIPPAAPGARSEPSEYLLDVLSSVRERRIA